MKKLFAVFAFTLATSAQAVEYSTCVGCHGANGEGGVGPTLQGQTKGSIASKLIMYRNGEQLGPMSSIMVPMATNLTDAEIDALAEEISNL